MSGAAQAQELRLADGRALAYALYGAPLAGAKAVIIYHHGVPASHVEVEPLGKAAAPLGVAVVAVERSGMGGSAPNPKMSVQSVAEDVRQLMDALSIPSAAQVGESGGGPYAAACAALLPQRTSSLVLLASVAAVDGRERRALLRDVGLPDRWCMNTIPGRLGGNRVINWLLRRLATKMPGRLIEGAGDALGPCDAEYFKEEPEAGAWVARFVARAYQQGIGGVVRDYEVLRSAWGVDLSSIKCRTAIWQGAGDNSVAPSHARWWAQAVPGSELHVVEGEGHVSLVGRHAARILQDMLDGSTAAPAPAAVAAPAAP